ncbi:MAG: 23S rRNA (adenine(2503)-C(2))-methyltransferase RlmN [Candidatus Moraniibacteriota bacterium]
MNIEKIQQFLLENNLPKFRLGQIQKAVFMDAVSSFSEITTLSKDLREKMDKEMKILSFEIEKVLVAKDGQSAKALLRLRGCHPERISQQADESKDLSSDLFTKVEMTNDLIETVLISPKPNSWSVCVSCQVGCAMGCRFCATGKMGFVRNLTAEEITDQILFWKQYLNKNPKSKILNPKIDGVKDYKEENSISFQNSKFEIQNSDVSNIVFMGMGEPFQNWENVSQSIRDLTDEKLFGFGSRSLSVSTAGIASGIEKMAREFPQVNLAISLHFASDEKRERFMPINKVDNLESLKKALQNYFQLTRRKVFLEYIMLEGINDSALDAKMLAQYLHAIGSTQLLHVNLIRYNATAISVIPDLVRNPELNHTNLAVTKILNPPAGGQDDTMLKPSSKTRTQLFKQELAKYFINATIRKSLGEEIKGACGQLAS